MIPASIKRSLRAKLLLAVMVCALVPLAALGIWLSSSALRSGEMLLRSQLDSTASRAAAVAQQRWQYRKSDLLLLATNAPVRASLRESAAAADSAPAFARRAFATMPGILAVVVRDATQRERWRLGDAAAAPPDRGAISQGSVVQPMLMSLRSPITDDDSNRTLGEAEALIRLDALAPSVPTTEVAPSQFVALHDRNSGVWLAPPGLAEASLGVERFVWNDHRWLAVRHQLDDPPLDVVAAAQLEPFLAPFTRTASAGAIAMTLAALVVVALTLVVTGWLTGSLSRLAAGADRVSDGQLDSRIDVTSDDEVGRVASAFNAMLDNLSRMMHELSQREAVAAMGELAATLAHQLRSPATAIKLDVQRAHDKLPSDSGERALLARALVQLDRLESAVTGSLKVARSAGAEFGDVDLRGPLCRAITGVRGECRQRQITIDESKVGDVPVVVRGDSPSLEQLFTNVITNAVQASAEGASVRISVAAREQGSVAVVVRDEGAGMSAEVLARAGEPMFSTKPEGTGLGLAIANRIAAAHRGTVSLDSTPGRGTSVTIKLPRAAVVAVPSGS